MEQCLASSSLDERIHLWPDDADSISFRPADLTGVDTMLGDFRGSKNHVGSGIDISPIKNEDVLAMMQMLRGRTAGPRNSASKRRKMQSIKVARALDNLSTIMGTPTRLSLSRPKSATKLISPESPKLQSAKKTYESEVHYLFNVAGMTSPFMITPPPNSRAVNMRPRAVHLSSLEAGDLAHALLMCDDEAVTAPPCEKDVRRTPIAARDQSAMQSSARKSAVKLNLAPSSYSPPSATSYAPSARQIPRTPNVASALTGIAPRTIPRLDTKAENSAKKSIPVPTKSPKLSESCKQFTKCEPSVCEGSYSPSRSRQPQSSMKLSGNISRIPKSPARPTTPSRANSAIARDSIAPGRQLLRTPVQQSMGHSPPRHVSGSSSQVTPPRSPLRQLPVSSPTMPKTASERARLVSSPTNIRRSKSPARSLSPRSPNIAKTQSHSPGENNPAAIVQHTRSSKLTTNFAENKENSRSYCNIPSHLSTIVMSKESSCLHLSEDFDFNIDSYVTKSTSSKPVRFSEEEKTLLDAMTLMTSNTLLSKNSPVLPVEDDKDQAFFHSVMQSCDSILAQLDAAVSKGPVRSPTIKV